MKAFLTNVAKGQVITDEGMGLKHYAAIKLKVPNSGIDWLDEMIEESLKNDFAAKAMQAILTKTPLLSETGEHGKKASHKDISNLHRNICFTAYSIADAMMEARK